MTSRLSKAQLNISPIKRASMSFGFTLIELLVVVALIVLLIAMLLPQLHSAKRNARIVVCLANLHQHGEAFGAYHRDNLQFYPITNNWADLSGKIGTVGHYNANQYDYEDRPLNEYLGTPESSRCPSDLGDSYNSPNFDAITNCYEQYGNSYQAPFSYNVLRTAYVIGDMTPAGLVSVKPRRANSFGAHMANKLVQADWVWWGNRPLSNPKSWWHTNGFERKYNVLFADFHCEFFTFPLDQDDHWPNFEPPNPDNPWW